jgi:hypothetical protein
MAQCALAVRGREGHEYSRATAKPRRRDPVIALANGVTR